MRLRIIVLMTISILIIVSGCGIVNSEDGEEQAEVPVLQNLGVNLASYDPETGTAGALLFDENIPEPKVFSEFGNTVKDHTGVDKYLPNYFYFTVPGADVIAPADLTVTQVVADSEEPDGTIEYALRFGVPGANPDPWLISFEHIVDVRVEEGDQVEAGDVVATAAPYYSPEPETTDYGYFLIQINIGENTHPCPSTLLDDSMQDKYSELLTGIMDAWEEFRSDDSIYQQAEHSPPGCLFDELYHRDDGFLYPTP